MVKNLPANGGDAKDEGSSPLVRKIPLEKEMATHSNILARIISWVAGYSPYSHRVGHD